MKNFVFDDVGLCFGCVALSVRDLGACKCCVRQGGYSDLYLSRRSTKKEQLLGGGYFPQKGRNPSYVAPCSSCSHLFARGRFYQPCALCTHGDGALKRELRRNYYQKQTNWFDRAKAKKGTFR